jgi:hypothetical protein
MATPRRWRIPAAEGAHRTPRVPLEVDAREQRVDRGLAPGALVEPLEPREVVERGARRERRPEPEVLRQVPELGARALRIGEHVEVAQAHRARRRGAGGWRRCA